MNDLTPFLIQALYDSINIILDVMKNMELTYATAGDGISLYVCRINTNDSVVEKIFGVVVGRNNVEKRSCLVSRLMRLRALSLFRKPVNKNLLLPTSSKYDRSLIKTLTSP
jgi:hypothetical protein